MCFGARDACVGSYTARLFEACCRDRRDFDARATLSSRNEYRSPAPSSDNAKSRLLQK